MRKSACLAMLAAMLLMSACSKTYMEGNMDVADDDYQAAIVKYEQTLAQRPTYDLGWLHLGYAYFKMGQYDKAIEAFNRTLDLREGQPDAEFFRALSYIGLGKLDQGFQLLAEYKDPTLNDMSEYIREQAVGLQGQGLSPDAIIANMEQARDMGYCMNIQDQTIDGAFGIEGIMRTLEIPLTNQSACFGVPH